MCDEERLAFYNRMMELERQCAVLEVEAHHLENFAHEQSHIIDENVLEHSRTRPRLSLSYPHAESVAPSPSHPEEHAVDENDHVELQKKKLPEPPRAAPRPPETAPRPPEPLEPIDITAIISAATSFNTEINAVDCHCTNRLNELVCRYFDILTIRNLHCQM